MADLLTDIRAQMLRRLEELRPLIAEAAQLEAAVAALDPPAQTPSRHAAQSPASRRARSPRGSSRETIVADLKAHGPSTAKEISERTGLHRGSLSTLLTRLAGSGELAKAERGYAVASSAPEPNGQPSSSSSGLDDEPAATEAPSVAADDRPD